MRHFKKFPKVALNSYDKSVLRNVLSQNPDIFLFQLSNRCILKARKKERKTPNTDINSLKQECLRSR